LKVGLMTKAILQAANFAGLLAWREGRPVWAAAWPSRDAARFEPVGEDGSMQTIRRSGLRVSYSAVQSRVGDGLLVLGDER
jgi:hypothetical protein